MKSISLFKSRYSQVFRYLGQSENKEISEKCYELDLDIEDAVERKEKAVGKIEIVSSIDGNIRKGLQKIGCI